MPTFSTNKRLLPGFPLRVRKWTRKAANKHSRHVKRFDNVDFFILDDVPRGANAIRGVGTPAFVLHEDKCDDMHHLWASYGAPNMVVKGIRMNAGDTAQQFTQRITQELQLRSANDLTIFYFHGTAFQAQRNYMLKFLGPGPSTVNGDDFLTQLRASSTNIIVMLDSNFPTRGHKIYRRDGLIMEITISGKDRTDINGNITHNDTGFTESMCRVLGKYANDPKTGKKRRSILQLMKYDRTMYSNPIRYWLSKPKMGSTKKLQRVVLRPAAVRRTGKLELFRVDIQGKDWRSGTGSDEDSSNGSDRDSDGADGDDSSSESDETDDDNDNDNDNEIVEGEENDEDDEDDGDDRRRSRKRALLPASSRGGRSRSRSMKSESPFLLEGIGERQDSPLFMDDVAKREDSLNFRHNTERRTNVRESADLTPTRETGFWNGILDPRGSGPRTGIRDAMDLTGNDENATRPGIRDTMDLTADDEVEAERKPVAYLDLDLRATGRTAQEPLDLTSDDEDADMLWLDPEFSMLAMARGRARSPDLIDEWA